jgi:hypothetical protein
MEKIKLQNYKSTIVIAIILLLLGSVILYWDLFSDIKLKISGAKLDQDTSKVLLCLISIGPFIASLNYVIKYISVLRYGEFVVILDNTSIRYPEDGFFRGFKAITIDKQQIKFVELEKISQHNYRINLKNYDHVTVGKISGELLHRKTIGINELAQKIDSWLKSR